MSKETSYKHSCVIDKTGNYITFVLVLLEPDEQGKTQENVQCYSLSLGESLIDVPAPTGFVKPHWGGTSWVEAATPEEIAAWEREHPAPTPPEPSPADKLHAENKLLKAQLAATTDRQDFMEDCIAEMAVQVYSA